MCLNFYKFINIAIYLRSCAKTYSRFRDSATIYEEEIYKRKKIFCR